MGGGGGLGLAMIGGNGGDMCIVGSVPLGGGVVHISMASSHTVTSGWGYSHWLSPVVAF